MAKSGVAAAAGWTTLGGVVNQALTFGISVALARILAPADFGLLAMVGALTGFIRVLADFGVSSALIQARDLTDDDYSAVFWLNMLISATLGVIVAGSAGLIASFYHEPKVRLITLAIAPQFLLAALGSVHNSRLQKRLAFAPLIKLELGSLLVGGVSAVVAARCNWATWSLVLRTYVQALVFVIGVYALEPWLPAFKPKLHLVRRFLHFSLHLTGSRALNYWMRNIDNVLIARYFGPFQVALYTRGYSTLLQPLSFLTNSLSRVMFPAMSAIQGDKERTRVLYTKAVRAIAFVVFPLMAVLFVTSADFIGVVFGPQWLGSLGVLRIFCVLGALQGVAATAGWVFQSQGRADLQMWWSVVAGAMIIGSIFLGVSLGSVETVALSYAICSGGILLVPALEVPGRLIGMGFISVTRVVAPALGCALAAAIAAWCVALAVPHVPPILRLASVWIVGGGCYLAFAWLFRLVALREMLGLLQRLRQRGSSRSPAQSVP